MRGGEGGGEGEGDGHGDGLFFFFFNLHRHLTASPPSPRHRHLQVRFNTSLISSLSLLLTFSVMLMTTNPRLTFGAVLKPSAAPRSLI